MRLKHFAIIVTMMLFSCKKDNIDGGKKVEIYLLSSYQMVQGKCQVDGINVLLQPSPLVINDDIVKYYKGNYEFELTAGVLQKINILADGTHLQ